MTKIRFRVNIREATRQGLPTPEFGFASLEIDPAAMSQDERDTFAPRLDDAGFVASRGLDGMFAVAKDGNIHEVTCYESAVTSYRHVAISVAAQTLYAVLAEIRREDAAWGEEMKRIADAPAMPAPEPYGQDDGPDFISQYIMDRKADRVASDN